MKNSLCGLQNVSRAIFLEVIRHQWINLLKWVIPFCGKVDPQEPGNFWVQVHSLFQSVMAGRWWALEAERLFMKLGFCANWLHVFTQFT